MSPEPLTQNPINPELQDLLTRAEIQLNTSREIVDTFLKLRQEGETAIQNLIESNNELAKALRLFAQDKSPVETSSVIPSTESSAMKVAKGFLRPPELNDRHYFNHARGKILLELVSANLYALDGVALSDLVAVSGCSESTVKRAIRAIREFMTGTKYFYVTDIGRGYEVREVAPDKWALVKL